MSRNAVVPVYPDLAFRVTSREGRVSRNLPLPELALSVLVTSREGRVSRNIHSNIPLLGAVVTSREGRVSRNIAESAGGRNALRHVPRGACE